MKTIQELQARIDELEDQLSRAQGASPELDGQLAAFVQVVPVVMWAIDSTGAVTLSDGRGLQSLGLQPGELVGANVFDLYASLPEALSPIRRALEGRPGSSVVDLGDTHWENHYFPVLDAEGAVTGLVGVSRDVTAQVLAERSQRASEERWQSLMAHTPDVVMLVDQDFRLVYLNKTLSRPMDEVIGSRLHDWIRPEDIRAVEQAVETAFAGGEARTLLAGQLDEDRWFLARIFPIAGDDQLVAYVASDITEQRRAERERAQLDDRLRHLQKVESLGVLAGGIAHDFNNLLVGILGNADLAREMLPPGPEREALDDVLHASYRARELCRQLLDYSGRGRFQLSRVDLSDLVAEMQPLVEVPRQQGSRLLLELAEELPAVKVDATQMRQVVMNLVTNGVEATEGGCTVHVRTRHAWFEASELKRTELRDEPPAGQYVVVEVQDDGDGIPDEVRPRMFDPFFSTKQTGRGLGMAAVQGILRAHGGALLLETTPGTGSRIQVLVPIADPRPPPTSEREREPTAATGIGLVLVADDEPLVLRVTATALERQGFEVVQATGGQQAIQRFTEQQRRIVLVLLDLSMPGTSGLQALEAIRQLSPDVPAILASGYSDDHLSEAQGPRTRFLSKPFRISELQHLVAEVLQL